MNPPSSSNPATVDEQIVGLFEAAWRQGTPVAIDSVLPVTTDDYYLATLEELVHIELEFLWKKFNEDRLHGTVAVRPPRVEEYLSRFPALDVPAVVLRLAKEEYRTRLANSDRPEPDEYIKRFGHLIERDEVFQTGATSPNDPFFDLTVTKWCDTRSNRANDAPGMGAGAQFGEYTLLERLGEGGMGIVWRAQHPGLNRQEAIKVIRGGNVSGEALDRFRFEAEAAARLDHPNIVPIYRVGESKGQPFIAMKLVTGGSLIERLPVLKHEPRRLAALLAKVARAVHYAHQRGILHRDLKPGNILIDQTGEPQIVDFGLAKRLDDDAEGIQSGQIAGTPAYMSPEQARREKALTTAADIYALGTILFEMLTGRVPFQAKNVLDLLQQVRECPAPRPSTFGKIDRTLETICLHCLGKSPEDRYPTALALAEDLERYLNGDAVSVEPPGIGDWLRFELRRSPAQAPHYTWPALAWSGAIVLAVHMAIFGIVYDSLPAIWIWIAFGSGWIALCAVVWTYAARRFRLLPTYERQKMMVGVGYLFAQLMLFFSYVPLSLDAPPSYLLGWYVPALMGAGLSFFFVGIVHWGRFFLIGGAVMAMSIPLAIYPSWSPLLYGVIVSACLWWWTYSLRRYYMPGGMNNDAERR